MDKRTQQNKDFFNSLANDWDARQKLSDDDVFNLVKLANINPGDKVLDVACGTGIIDKHLLKLGAKNVVAIDLSENMIAIAKSPFYIREQLFWSKLETFLNGIYLEESDRAILRAKLAENGNSNENALRLVASIDRAETMQKIQYLVNVTRGLLTNFTQSIPRVHY